jgi:hypothetical protein
VKEKLHTTGGFTQAEGELRRKFCANLEVFRPPEVLWNPRLREAAAPLSVSKVEASSIKNEKNLPK